jgi:modification methylase
MPIPQKLVPQDTRYLTDIAGDIKQHILAQTNLRLFSVFIWQKQTSKLMFGSYPHPGNLLECNTTEFVHVYVKPGKPPRFSPEVKAANRLTRAEHVDLVQQVWCMYPADVKRGSGHPSPFPEKLPARLIRMYTFGAAGDFAGEVVLDPFCGTGTTCAVAKRMGRGYVGIDINERYVAMARERIANAVAGDVPMLFCGRGEYPGKDRLEVLSQEGARTAGKKAAAKHRRKTYGRG